MRDLTAISGLPLRLDEATGTLTTDGSWALPAANVRTLAEMRPLLEGADAGPDDRPCYLMYRDVRRDADAASLDAAGLRYDLTVTLPGRLGNELMKTAGHYHVVEPASGRTYPELYEVLHGAALFLLQRVRDPEAALGDLVVEEVLLVAARPGECLLIPPDCGHVTINAGREPLVVADLIASASANRYGAFREARGAAYYVYPHGSPPRASANPAYPALPPLRWYPSPATAGLAISDLPLYRAALASPDRFAYLTNPALLDDARRAARARQDR